MSYQVLSIKEVRPSAILPDGKYIGTLKDYNIVVEYGVRKFDLNVHVGMSKPVEVLVTIEAGKGTYEYFKNR